MDRILFRMLRPETRLVWQCVVPEVILRSDCAALRFTQPATVFAAARAGIPQQ
jgi:hypothetical protein